MNTIHGIVQKKRESEWADAQVYFHYRDHNLLNVRTPSGVCTHLQVYDGDLVLHTIDDVAAALLKVGSASTFTVAGNVKVRI